MELSKLLAFWPQEYLREYAFEVIFTTYMQLICMAVDARVILNRWFAVAAIFLVSP